MKRKEVLFKSKIGMHLRPAAEIAKLAGKFNSDIFIGIDSDNKISAKSIIGILALTIQPNTELILEAEGKDADAALEALADLISNRIVDL